MSDFGFPDEDDEMFRAIGAFIYSFSQLELTIRLRLGQALELSNEMAEVVVGPYDFATLCNVSREVLKRTNKDLDPDYVTKLFNRCLALNQKARVVIAHATWFSGGGGANHFSKNTFQSTKHFEDVKDINVKTAEAKHLMLHFIGKTGWKGVSDLGVEIPPL